MGLLEAFSRDYLSRQEAFRRHDFEATFAALREDVVWEPVPEMVDRVQVRGKAAVLEFFHALVQQWPDWRTEVREITEPEPGLIRVHFIASGRASAYGV